MARKTKDTNETENIIITEQKITDTLELNYMPYAMSVIVSRAIPEIDGFKPVSYTHLDVYKRQTLVKANFNTDVKFALVK